MPPTVDDRIDAENPNQAWLEALDRQRRALRMPLDIVAARSGLSRATVCRVLIDKNVSSHLDNVIAIARVLGVTFEICIEQPDLLIERHVQEQAKQLVQMVQGSMALEAQGITNPDHLAELVDVAAREIRKKPRKKLWERKCHSVNRSRVKRPSPTSPS
jgi:transcriptional regulator with XRE-family HTH domain